MPAPEPIKEGEPPTHLALSLAKRTRTTMHTTSPHPRSFTICGATLVKATLAMLLFGSACGPGNNDSSNLKPGPRPRDMASTDKDMKGTEGDMSGDMAPDSDVPDGGLPDGGGPDAGDMDIISTDGICANVTDLGTLDLSEDFILLTGSTREPTTINQFSTRCGSGAAPPNL